LSRSQQGQVFNTTQGQSTQSFGDSQNDYTIANKDIGDFQQQLGELKAENPFTMGGEFQQSENMELANTSDAQAAAAGATLQGAAERTGQNPAGAIGATEAIQQENERSLAGQESAANQQRIGAEAGYNENVTNEFGKVPGMEAGIAEGEGSLYKTALGEEEDAAKTPSFMDTMGDAFGSAFGQGIGKLGAAGVSAALTCWVAAEIYGGWYEPRTVAVRQWLNTEFVKQPLGRTVMAVYRKTGRQVAWFVHRSSLLRKMLKPLFDKALYLATGKKE
jgi:hypothetical protein